MFYIKYGMYEEATLAVPITTENVFTKCNKCEREIKVDLEEILKDGDLTSTKLVCQECI
jgi:hypothetical protein